MLIILLYNSVEVDTLDRCKKQIEAQGELMKIDKQLLNKLCDLALLKITLEEEKILQAHLTEILSHFQKISAVNTKGVAPLVNPLENNLQMREDELQNFQDKEGCLNQAPRRQGRLVKTVPVV